MLVDSGNPGHLVVEKELTAWWKSKIHTQFPLLLHSSVVWACDKNAARPWVRFPAGLRCVFSSDLPVSSFIFVGAEGEENLIRKNPDKERVYDWSICIFGNLKLEFFFLFLPLHSFSAVVKTCRSKSKQSQSVIFILSEKLKAGPPPLDLSFWTFLTFLHHGIEEVKRHLLWKFYIKNSKEKLVKCATEVGRLHRVSIQSCTQNRPSPKVQSLSRDLI